ncbi:MAG TPA: hypothetical protein DCP25_18520 [Chloroflexi bacterium]|nr:hypothetical protein [Chloroflexota bacterium]
MLGLETKRDTHAIWPCSGPSATVVTTIASAGGRGAAVGSNDGVVDGLGTTDDGDDAEATVGVADTDTVGVGALHAIALAIPMARTVRIRMAASRARPDRIQVRRTHVICLNERRLAGSAARLR